MAEFKAMALEGVTQERVTIRERHGGLRPGILDV